MSVVTYGNVTLPYAFATVFTQEAVGDEASDTDWYLMKFDIHVQSVLNIQHLSIIDPTLVGVATNPADVALAIRKRLMQRRKQLQVTFNGTDLIPQPQAGLAGTVDARNGPKPISCTYQMLTNTTFLFTYHVTAHYWESPNTLNPEPLGQNLPGNNVLYNRWSESVDIDGINGITRTREGKFVIRSDNREGKIADQCRDQMAVVGIPVGFLRDSSSYTVDPSGLGIRYRVVDKQQYKMPPSPAYRVGDDCYYFESTTNMGAVRYAEVNISLEGGMNDDQAKLVETAVAVASKKLEISGAPIGGVPAEQRAIPLFGGVKVAMYKNRVTVNVKAQMRSGKRRLSGLDFVRRTICTTPAPAPGASYQPTYFLRGSIPFLLKAAAYYDPSLQDTNMIGDQLSAGLAPGQAGVNPEA